MLFVILLCSVFLLLFTIVALLTWQGWGFFRPTNNVEFVNLRGMIADSFIRGRTNSFPVKDPVTGKWTLVKEDINPIENALLYEPFGIRYLGFPGVHKLGDVVINYPPQLHSAVEGTHVQGNIVPGLDIHHNYRVVLNGIEFQGGISFDLEFNLEIVLVRPDVAWGRNGRFLDPIGQAIEGAIAQFALGIDATEFIGKTSQYEDSDAGRQLAEAAVQRSKQLRIDMCRACMALNDNVNQGKPELPVPLEVTCGYRIDSISYKNIKPSDDGISKQRLGMLETLNEAGLKIQIAQKDLERAGIEAKAEAARVKGPGIAKTEVDRAAGMVQAEVTLAVGKSEAEALTLKRAAVGDPALVATILGQAVKDSKLQTLVIGNGANTMLQLPAVTTEAPKKPEQSEKPKI